MCGLLGTKKRPCIFKTCPNAFFEISWLLGGIAFRFTFLLGRSSRGFGNGVTMGSLLESARMIAASEVEKAEKQRKTIQ